MSYYSSDDDLDIHVRRRGHSPRPPPPAPPPVRYVERPHEREYYGRPAGPSFLVPEQRTTIVARERSRSRERPSPPAPPAPANPVIINNRFYNDHSSDEDDRTEHRRKSQLVRRHHKERSSSSSSRSRSYSRSRSRSGAFMSRDEWEAEQARRELAQMRISNARDKDERRREKEYQDDAELKRAKQELDDIKAREARSQEEKRITRDLELKRLKEEEDAAEEKKLREKEARDAVEAYKIKEAERIAKEKKEKEQNEKEYQRRLQEDLIKSGLDEKAIAAILKKEKIPKEAETAPPDNGRSTHTRMARKHLSIETLRTFRIDFDYDTDPNFFLIKRWVPEWEQDQLWKHTKIIREKRTRGLVVEERRHRRSEPEFEWVRKKERKRSKSPGLLMYLAGGRPN